MQKHQVAIVHESECIGCTKCISACPVDAILGSKNQMHTVIAEECIGCKLCIPPCPVDCIDIIDAMTVKPEPALVKRRHQARKARLTEAPLQSEDINAHDKKRYVMDALARMKRSR